MQLRRTSNAGQALAAGRWCGFQQTSNLLSEAIHSIRFQKNSSCMREPNVASRLALVFRVTAGNDKTVLNRFMLAIPTSSNKKNILIYEL